MYKFDYHMHSNYSTDSFQELEELINRCIELKLNEIAITDHVDFNSSGELILGQYPFDEYRLNIENLSNKYKEKIVILKGIELGLNQHAKKNIENFVSKYNFDFVIASSHDCHAKDLWSGEFFIGKEKQLAFRQYFEEVYENICYYDCFSVYGHLDYVRRYGSYEDDSLSYFDYKDIIDKILVKLIEKNKGLEVNTSGFRYALNQVHPSLDILKRYKELGGTILTIGSDAHKKEDVTDEFYKALEIIKLSGFTQLTTFKDMKPTLVDIFEM